MSPVTVCHGYGDEPKIKIVSFTPAQDWAAAWSVQWLQPVNQIVETWKSFDCGHSWEVVWPGPKHRHNTQIMRSYFAENRHQACLSEKDSKSQNRLPPSDSYHISEISGRQWLWMCITHLIVFHIILLWGLFSFILSPRWVNSFPVAACRWSSFKSTDKHRPQTSRREITSYPLCSPSFLWSSTLWMLSLDRLRGGCIAEPQGPSANINKVLIENFPK